VNYSPIFTIAMIAIGECILEPLKLALDGV
jgi:hypothetical protein